MDRQRIREKTPKVGEAVKRRAAEWTAQPIFGTAVRLTAGFALAFSAMGSGIAPFGLAYVAMCPQGSLAAAAGAFGGYALAYGSGGLIYAAAVLICLACKIVFGSARVARTPYLMPLCAFASLVCVKSAAAVQGGLMGVVLLLCEAALCAGFCLLFDAAVREQPLLRTGPVWGRLAMLVAVLLIFEPIRVLGDIAPARVAAALAVMATACFGGSAMGAASGVAVGACVDLAGAAGPFFAAAYGFSGLVGGVGRRQGRFACAVSYVLANCVATMWGHAHPNAMAGLFECFIASVVFVMLPDGAFVRLEAWFGVAEPTAGVQRAGTRSFALGRLQAVGAAIGELGAAMDGMAQSLRRPGEHINKVFDRAAERVCRRCPTASVCWEREYIATHNALNDVGVALRKKNGVREDDFPAHFVGRCTHIKQFCGAINEEYRVFLRRRAAASREADSRSLMGRQYSSLQGVLCDMAGSAAVSPEFFPALEARVRAIAKAYCKPGRVSVYTLAGRLHAEIALSGADNTPSDPEAFLRSLSLALKRRMWPPETLPARGGVILRVSERERLSATVNCAVRKKQGETVCGDAAAHLHTDDGRAVVLLSDGMGTGNAAGALSGKAVELISGFVRSGCSLYESARAVMPVLAARFEHSGFVTLDLLEINLFTGQANLIKYGAAPSFVLRDGRIERLAGQALPAGLGSLADTPEPLGFRLEPGDRVVMMSDGVWDNSDTERTLREAWEQEPGELSGHMIGAAVRAGAVDDMSVLVVSVSEN